MVSPALFKGVCSQCKPAVYCCFWLWWFIWLPFPSPPILPLSTCLPLPHHHLQASQSTVLPLPPAMLVLHAPDGHWLDHSLENNNLHAHRVDCWYPLPYSSLLEHITTQLPLFWPSATVTLTTSSASSYAPICSLPPSFLHHLFLFELLTHHAFVAGLMVKWGSPASYMPLCMQSQHHHSTQHSGRQWFLLHL